MTGIRPGISTDWTVIKPIDKCFVCKRGDKILETFAECWCEVWLLNNKTDWSRPGRSWDKTAVSAQESSRLWGWGRLDKASPNSRPCWMFSLVLNEWLWCNWVFGGVTVEPRQLQDTLLSVKEVLDQKHIRELDFNSMLLLPASFLCTNILLVKPSKSITFFFSPKCKSSEQNTPYLLSPWRPPIR